MPKPSRRRCDARLPKRIGARDRAMRAGELAKYLRRDRCKNWALPGSKRCRLHGGRSTGPTTPEGMARTVAAMNAGRVRWLARLKAEGKPVPCGRKKGGRNRSAEERERVAYEQECHRAWRDMAQRMQVDRKARHARRRQEREEVRFKAEDHARRRARMETGLPYWTDEEWENL
jgi:hypothetical protein